MTRVIIYDGMCNLCGKTVMNIAKFDSRNNFLFAKLEGDKGQEIIAKFYLQTKNIDSIILYNNDQIKIKSNAIIEIFYNLHPIFKPILILKIIPSFVLDYLYDIIAMKRYKWFGKRKKCIIPNKNVAHRFLE